MNTRWIIIKNAVANLGRAGASGLVTLFLPPLLVRHMTATDYGIWILVLQCAAYIGYLDFGLQTAVGRYVAYSNEKNDIEQRNSIFTTAFAVLVAAALLSLLLLLGAIAAVQLVFPSIPAGTIHMMRWSMLILGGSLALGLPASAWSGIFVGLQRYEIPALAIGGARLVSAVGVVLLAIAGKSIVTMAAIMAIANIACYGVQYVAMRRIVPDIKFDVGLVRRSTAKELLEYCSGLMVMSFSMLLVTGLDLILVGRFQFSAVIPYAVSASMITVLTGGLGAILNVMMPHAAALHARQNPEALGQLVITSTQVAILLLVFTAIPLVIFAGPILTLWIGQKYVQMGQPLLTILLVANIARLIIAPYVIVVTSAGRPWSIKVSPLIEAISNLVASLVLGAVMGAIGVALGTVIGSVIGIAAHAFCSMPRTNQDIRFSRRKYFVSGVLTPLVCTAPLLIAGVFSLTSSPSLPAHPAVFLPAVAFSVVGAALLLRRSGILLLNERAPV